MEEYEKNDTSIRILYGRDPLKGVYLSVYDQRLTSKDETSGDLKKAVKKSGTTYRNGAYFDLRTGPSGYGSKVTMDVIAFYLKRFGAENEHIVKLVGMKIARSVGALTVMKAGGQPKKTDLQKENIQPKLQDLQTSTETKVNQIKNQLGLFLRSFVLCCRCDNPAIVRCAPCQVNVGRFTYYCSRECQKADWKKHKPFCGLKFPEKMPVIFEDRRWPVFALLFPEDEKQPKLMEISLPLTLPLLASYVGINSCDVFDTELYKVDPGYARIRRLLGEGPYADAVFCRHPEPVHDSYAEDVQAFLQGKLAIHGPEDPCVGDHEKVVRFRLLYRLDYPSDDRSNLNQCILSVTGGEMCHPWAGPVLAFRLIGVQNPSVSEFLRDIMFAYTYRDVELTDGRDMVDYFKRPGGPANDRKPVKPKFQWSYPYAR